MWVIITIAVILFTIKLVVFPETSISMKHIFIYILGVLIILLTSGLIFLQLICVLVNIR